MALIEADLEHTYYWTDDWSPDFYIALARAGFISTSVEHPEFGCVLIPEIQAAYAVLDHDSLHISKNVAKLMRSGRLADERIRLKVADDCTGVLNRLTRYHNEATWLSETYCDLAHQLPSGPVGEFRLRAVELWSETEDRLIAGELGYTIGRTYTSLTGFCDPSEKRWSNFGTLQLVLLSAELKERGYAFWNLGHPQLTYKLDLGARATPRPEFLTRWRAAISERPATEL